MKLYKVSQSHDNNYDTYDSAIVAAKDAEHAKTISPDGSEIHLAAEWQQPDKLKVELIGAAVRGTKAGLVLASFNAG